MHPQYSALFTTLAEYVGTRHRCFVAELDFSRTKWVMCIRPTEENVHALERTVYACKYFSFSVEEADGICRGNALGSNLMERIDRELRSLRDSVPDKRCRLRWSTQHLLGVYSQEPRSLEFFLDVDSSAARPGRAALEKRATGRFLAGSIRIQLILEIGWVLSGIPDRSESPWES
jgi:hypothetical protein